MNLIAALTAQLIVDDLQLFPQVVLALALIDLLPHLVADLVLQVGQLRIAAQRHRQSLQPVNGMNCVEKLLALLPCLQQFVPKKVRQLARVWVSPQLGAHIREALPLCLFLEGIELDHVLVQQTLH